MIGCEPFLNGVAKLLVAIDEEGLNNIRIHPDDARDVLEWLPAASIGRVFVLHPDPWPKKRHWKRRFISARTLDRLARIMKPGGELRIASDIPSYIDWTLRLAAFHPALEWMAAGPADWREAPADWPRTRYEAKAVREGRTPAYLIFRRR
jgi:tRNA (guanine-N7-)-methyltransferase